jgi:glutamyl-tRNA synthetase
MKDLILKYTLQNAVKYGGKANIKAVVGKILSEKPQLRKDVKSLYKETAEIIKQVNSLTPQQQKSKLNSIAPGLLEEKPKEQKLLAELPDLEKFKKIIMRVAPYPSGPLHIGNIKQIVLNDYYVKKYKGDLLLVIDDTIGSKEKDITKDAYSLIPEALKWMKINYKKIYYKSDRLLIYYKYAKELIKEGQAYVCFCSQKQLHDNRINQKECEHRKFSIKKNLEEFDKMLKEKYKQHQAVLRIKTSMQHPNPAFRDRVLFRISNRKHPRTGLKYKVWPLLELSWAVDDHLFNISHVLRGKELQIESEMEKYIWNIFKWKHPIIIHSGLLQIKGIKLSKTKSKKEVLSGKYFGWHDPRTWSIQSLKSRGFYPEAIKNFILKLGLTETEITVPLDSLYAENRKIIEPLSNRYFFIENPVKIKIQNAPKRKIKLKLHPDFPKRGYRILDTTDEFYIPKEDYKILKDNKFYRLMDCLNFIKKGNKFIFDSMEYEKFKNKGEKIMHWLPVKNTIKVEVLMDDGKIIKGIAEKNLKKVKINSTIQFERRYFCKLNEKKKDKLVFWYTHK